MNHTVEIVPHDPLHDGGENDVVRVGVRPTLPRRKRRLQWKDVAHPVQDRPLPVRVGGDVFEKRRVQLVPHDAAGVVHEHAHGDVWGVGERVIPRLVSQVPGDGRVEIETPLAHELHGKGREERLPRAPRQHATVRGHRLSHGGVGPSGGHSKRRPIRKSDAKGRPGHLGGGEDVGQLGPKIGFELSGVLRRNLKRYGEGDDKARRVCKGA